MTLSDMLVIGLAVHQAVNIYRYSYYFQGWRAAREIGQPIRWLPGFLQEWASGLFSCPWCLSVVIAFLFTVAHAVSLLGQWLCVGLAASQVAGLVHFLTGHRGIKQD